MSKNMFPDNKLMKSQRNDNFMKITVQVSKKRSHSWRIDETDNVLDIKQKIEELEEIPESQQRILYMGTELPDYYIFSSDFEIDEKPKFICESKQLLVILHDSRVITVPIEARDTLHDVKRKLEKPTGIPYQNQCIFFSCCSSKGRQLDDSKTVFENDVDDNIVYMLQSNPGMQVFIEILETTRKIRNFSIDSNSSIIEIKRQVQRNFLHNIMDYKLFHQDYELSDTKSVDFYNIANNSTLQLCRDKIIYLKKVSGEKLMIKVELSNTVSQLKLSIAKELKVPSKNYIHLLFHGKELHKGSNTLYEYNIGYGMTVKVETGVIYKIFSKFRSAMTLELALTEKILNLKEQIKLKTGIPIDHQCIIDDDGLELLDSSPVVEAQDMYQLRYIEDYVIDSDIRHEVSLLVKSTVDIVLNAVIENTSHITEFMYTDTVFTVKKEILQKLDRPWTNYVCYFNSTHISDELTLANINGLCTMSCIDIVDKRQGLPIFIRTLAKKTFTIMIDRISIIVEDLKSKIEDREGISASMQILIFEEEIIQDGRTLTDYNIRRGATLDLRERLRGC